MKYEKESAEGEERKNESLFFEKRGLYLNAQQLKAACRIYGPTLLVSVPGSGKTTVIIARLANLILRHHICPKQLLTVTFSRTCAQDMKQRFYQAFPDLSQTAPEFRTIHSLCLKMIRAYEQKTGSRAFRLLSDAESVLAKLYREQTGEVPGEARLYEIQSQIAYCNHHCLSEEEICRIQVEGVSFYELFSAYRRWKRKNRQMDFDDLLKYAWLVLKKHSDILEAFQDRYRFISVDEAQDTSFLQHEILYLLCRKHGNLFMVGDEDQSIYGFRGAYPQAMLNFTERFPEGEILMMQTNYRSSASITAAADRFIRRNQTRSEKTMVSYLKQKTPVYHLVFEDAENQYAYLGRQAQIPDDKSRAVLYRNNESAVGLVHYFTKNKIPYCMKPHRNFFFSHFITDQIRIFFQLADQPWNTELFKTLRGAAGPSLTKALSDQFLCLNHLSPKEGLRFILERMHYEDYLKGRIHQGTGKDIPDHKLNLLFFIAKDCNSGKEFIGRLDFLAKCMENGSWDRKPNGTASILFSTVHSAKGLEFDSVFLIDAQEGSFPSLNKEYESAEEEARLFYVAVTRAKTGLTFLSVKNQYQGSAAPSSFIRDFLKGIPV